MTEWVLCPDCEEPYSLAKDGVLRCLGCEEARNTPRPATPKQWRYRQLPGDSKGQVLVDE